MNLVANFAREREKRERGRKKTQIWKRNEKDSILSSKREKETRFAGCENCELNDHLMHETGSIQEKELQQETEQLEAHLH